MFTNGRIWISNAWISERSPCRRSPSWCRRHRLEQLSGVASPAGQKQRIQRWEVKGHPPEVLQLWYFLARKFFLQSSPSVTFQLEKTGPNPPILAEPQTLQALSTVLHNGVYQMLQTNPRAVLQLLDLLRFYYVTQLVC